MPSTTEILTLFLIFVRISGVLMTAPVFSSRNVPTMVKIGFAALLSFLLLPIQTENLGEPAWPTSLLPFMLVVAEEILVGVLIGFVSNLFFVTVSLASTMMARQVGLQSAQLFNPLFDVQSTALEQVYTLLAIALFLAINGHHYLILALARTFELVPVGTFEFTGITTQRLVFMTNETFLVAAQISLPIVGSLLLTDLGLGLLAKAVPQIQVFFVALPLKLALGFALMAITLTIILPVLKETMAQTVTRDVWAIVSP
jgi:flagellar biosynthetic protein FliR